MSKELTEITTFSNGAELQIALEDAFRAGRMAGHWPINIEIAGGVLQLVEDTLTDGSKVGRIVIVQVKA